LSSIGQQHIAPPVDQLLKACEFPRLFPRQTDFAWIHIAAIKDALSGVNGDIDHCPISV
jgi:hypothetical protein